MKTTVAAVQMVSTPHVDENIAVARRLIADANQEITAAQRRAIEDLRREAQRRSRTQRKRPTWGLLAAAALPILAALGGLSGWGLQQKHRADALALQTQAQEQQLTQLASTHATEVARERQAKEAVVQQLQLASQRPGRRFEQNLVIPVEKPVKGGSEDFQRVKQKP